MTKIDIYTPNTFDMQIAIEETKDKTDYFPFALSAKCIGITYKQLMELPASDTQKIMEIVGKGFQIFRPNNK